VIDFCTDLQNREALPIIKNTMLGDVKIEYNYPISKSDEHCPFKKREAAKA
jgi:hypothetical protein